MITWNEYGEYWEEELSTKTKELITKFEEANELDLGFISGGGCEVDDIKLYYYNVSDNIDTVDVEFITYDNKSLIIISSDSYVGFDVRIIDINSNSFTLGMQKFIEMCSNKDYNMYGTVIIDNGTVVNDTTTFVENELEPIEYDNKIYHSIDVYLKRRFIDILNRAENHDQLGIITNVSNMTVEFSKGTKLISLAKFEIQCNDGKIYNLIITKDKQEIVERQ